MEILQIITIQTSPGRFEMKIILITLFLLVSATISVANAGCWIDGVEHPVGTVKGSMTCHPDGYWR